MSNARDWNQRHRRRRRRPPPTDTFSGFEPMQYSPLSPAGRLEQMGRLARSVNRLHGWRRWMVKSLATGLLLFIVLGLVFTLIGVLTAR